MIMTPHATDDLATLRRGIAVGMVLFAFVSAALFGLYIWIFRDGLGPEAIESSGLAAWRRFWNDFWPVATFCGLLCIVGAVIWPRNRRTQHST